MGVKLIAVTAPLVEGVGTAEELMVFCARVSNPSNQTNMDTAPKLLKYCLDKGHWSIFEQVDMTVEIETSRAIATQILRHRSFTFQEFSQRYSQATLGYQETRARRQDTKNRQNSVDDLPSHVTDWFARAQDEVWRLSQVYYEAALTLGVAKECARMLLPLSTTTRLYMKGSVRSWIHYLQTRTSPGTQKEHRDVALAVLDIFRDEFPVLGSLIGGVDETTNGGD